MRVISTISMRRWTDKIFRNTERIAAHRWAEVIVFGMELIGCTIFPLPNALIMVALVTAAPRKWLRFALGFRSRMVPDRVGHRFHISCLHHNRVVSRRRACGRLYRDEPVAVSCGTLSESRHSLGSRMRRHQVRRRQGSLLAQALLQVRGGRGRAASFCGIDGGNARRLNSQAL